MRQKFTRLLSLLLAVVMIASLFAVPTFASEEETSSEGAAESGSVTVTNGAADVEINDLQKEEGAPSVTEPPEPVFPDGEELPAPEVSESEASGEETEITVSAAQATAGEDGEETFTVSYYDSDKKLIKTETVKKDSAPAEVPSGVSAWLDKDGNVVDLSNIQITEDVSYYAWNKPHLLKSDTNHSSYISGNGDGNFTPTSALSRAQASSILYRLLESAEKGPYDSEFSDVPSGQWYSEGIAALASYGILAGNGNGKFNPSKNMTRAEFVSVLVRITDETGSGSAASFTDVSSHWAKNDIAIAAEKGWISGYKQDDGTYTFSPNQSITRAEAVSVINRVLGRANAKDTSDTASLSKDGIRHFLDVSESAWYYYAVMEASIGHVCSASGSTETWSSFTKETSGLSAGFHQVGSVFCYIDSNLQPVKLSAGMNQFGNTYLYTAAAGYTASMDFSSGKLLYPSGSTVALTEGVVPIKNANNSYYYFYWDGTSNKPKYLSQGVNVINNNGYWAAGNGFALQGGMKADTIVSLGGKNYMATGQYTVLTYGYAHSNDQSYLKKIDLKNKNFEYGNYMYHASADYSLLTNAYDGYLYFGKDCRYTSGDSTLDGYVWNIAKSYVNLAGQTQAQKLLAAYYQIRGGTGKTPGTSMFQYRPIGTIMATGRYNGVGIYRDFITCAKEMYSRGYGMCYQWAAAYHYVVRRLGLQSYLVVGSVWSNRARHCWNMIKWNGTWHISDLELEWGYLTGYYTGGGLKIYRNLFGMAVATEYLSSYSHPECDLTYYFP